MSRLTCRTAVAALAALTMTVAAACTPGNGVMTPTPAPTGPVTNTTSPTPTATPTPSPTSTEEIENNAAEQGVVNFWAMIDKLSTNPDRSLTGLSEVSRGESISTWQQVLTWHRKNGHRQVGSVGVRSVTAEKTKKGQWEATACIDVSKVNVIDKKGKSVVAADRPPRVKYNYVLERDGDNFYVINDEADGRC